MQDRWLKKQRVDRVSSWLPRFGIRDWPGDAGPIDMGCPGVQRYSRSREQAPADRRRRTDFISHRQIRFAA
jgi:hypothetical protein